MSQPGTCRFCGRIDLSGVRYTLRAETKGNGKPTQATQEVVLQPSVGCCRTCADITAATLFTRSRTLRED